MGLQDGKGGLGVSRSDCFFDVLRADVVFYQNFAAEGVFFGHDSIKEVFGAGVVMFEFFG